MFFRDFRELKIGLRGNDGAILRDEGRHSGPSRIKDREMRSHPQIGSATNITTNTKKTKL